MLQIIDIKLPNRRINLLKRLLLNNLHNPNQISLRQHLYQLRNIQQFLLIIILLIPLLLPIIKIPRLSNLRYLSRHFIYTLLNRIQTTLKLQLSCLLYVEQKFIGQLVQHAGVCLLIGEIFQVFEENHHTIFEGVYCMDVFLVLVLDVYQGIGKTHSCQILGEGGVSIVAAETLKNVFYLLCMFAFSFR